MSKINNIVVFGATSAIAFETCKLFANEGKSLTLIARDKEKLDSIKKDLLVRGAKKIETFHQDLSIIKKHKNLFEKIEDIDLLLIAYGILPKQEECNNNFDIEMNNFQVNFLSTCSILNFYASYFEKKYLEEEKKAGTIAVITSVAGDRGRQSNYSYGAAKGALSIYLQGLRHRLHKYNINVIDIKPGLVNTPMTKEIKKNLLFSSPQKVAKLIFNKIKCSNKAVYTPFLWRIIMLVIRNIPERVFLKLKI